MYCNTVKQCSLNRKQGSAPVFNHMGQKGCPNVIPGLRAMPVWRHGGSAGPSSQGEGGRATDFPWLTEVEAQFTRVRGEFLAQHGHQTDGTGIKFQVRSEWRGAVVSLLMSIVCTAVLCSLTRPRLQPRHQYRLQPVRNQLRLGSLTPRLHLPPHLPGPWTHTESSPPIPPDSGTSATCRCTMSRYPRRYQRQI